jgi:CubicO group peptidase (beta-lactamase class C family)
MRALPAALSGALLALAGCGSPGEPSLWNKLTLVAGDRRIENFRHMDRIFPERPVRRAGPVSALPRAASPVDPRQIAYVFDGEERRVSDLLTGRVATGLVVLKDGAIVYEAYYRGGDEASLFTTWSVAKSFVSALVGIAVADGLVAGIEHPVSEYVPELRGTGYDGVPIEDVLRMTSGVRFVEDYHRQVSDIRGLFYRMFFLHGRVDAFVAGQQSEAPPGTVFGYKSIDTQVLGMLLEHVTGEHNATWLADRLWGPLGMESDASWSLDRSGPEGRELAFCCLNATLRDWARFGLLYQHEGEWNGAQLVPRAWVVRSTAPAGPRDGPGEIPDTSMGYGFQWWIGPDGRGDFTALGVYGQSLYVSPADGVVIARSGADPDYAFPDDEALAAFRALAKAYAGGPSPAAAAAASTAGRP